MGVGLLIEPEFLKFLKLRDVLRERERNKKRERKLAPVISFHVSWGTEGQS